MRNKKAETEERKTLAISYEEANYFVRHGSDLILFKIGKKNFLLDELLIESGAKKWAFVTAYNCYSQLRPAEENEHAQAKLIDHLEKSGFDLLFGYGEDIDGDRDPEPSVFVFDIDRKTAIEIGNNFKQNAIVYGEIGTPPQLEWCSEDFEI